jgi:hypothetical protein
MLELTRFENKARRPAAPALAFLLACSLIAGQAAGVLAQQSPDMQASQLREQIAALETVERDDTAPVEVKLANRRFLTERRALLRGLLQKQIEGWRRYLAVVGPNLSAREKDEVEKTVRDLEAELQRAGQAATPGTPTTTAATGDPSAAAQPPATQTIPAEGFAAPSPSNLRTVLSASSNSGPSAAPAADPLPQNAATSGCYPDAPSVLVNAVHNKAHDIVIQNQAMEIAPLPFEIMLLTMAHAVTVDANGSTRQQAEDTLRQMTIARATAETKRTDKQIGASARSEGSTSAIEKPSFAELLGFAVEHGSVEKEINGTTLTLSTSPYAFFYHGQDDTATAYKNYSYLSRVGVSATFNIADQNNVLASATRNQLDEWSVRARLSADKSNRSDKAEQFWESVRHNFAAPAIFRTEEMKDIFANTDLNAKRKEIDRQFTGEEFQNELKAVLAKSSSNDEKTDEIAGLILCRLKTAIFDQVRSGAFALSQETKNRIITRTLPGLGQAMAVREKAISDFKAELDRLSYVPEFTFAYTNKRQETGSDYSTFKLLFQKKTREGLNIVANGGLSIYHRPDPTLHQQRLRDFAGALSLEGVLGRSPFLMQGGDESRVTFAFTGRFQRMMENRFFNDRKADIAVAQFKLELPLLAGISLPFSVTYANATELIKESHVRTNFGFTIDTDKILQIINLAKASQVK